MVKISSICTTILGGIIALIATLSLGINLISDQNIIAIGLDLLVIFVSYMTTWQGVSSIVEDRITSKKIHEEIKPMVNLLEETLGKVNGIEKELLTTNLKVNTTMEYVMKSQDMDASKVYILPGISFKFMIKVFSMILLTFGTLVFVTEFPVGVVHYLILVIYMAWWYLITSEFKLISNSTSWIWGVTPILIIPTLGIMLTSLVGINYMIGILFMMMFAYVYLYYSWASYLTTGYKLIDLKPIKYMIKDKILRK